jgi:hypothetical protein
MLDRQHARGERGFVVVIADRQRSLCHDRTAIDFGSHQMDGAPVDAHAVGEHPPVRVDTGIRRQKRRVNVEQPPGITRDKRRRQNAHEAGEDDQIWLLAIDGAAQRALELGALGERAMIDDRRCDAGR